MIKSFASLVAIVLFVVPMAVLAGPATESGEAGQTLAAAQVLPAGTTSILGQVTAEQDVDMYGFGWAGGNFLAEVAPCLSGLCPFQDPDSQLFVFNAAGNLLGSNDDGPTSFLPLLSVPSLAAGSYFLAISPFDVDPILTGGVLTSWSSDTFTEAPFDYEIRLNQATVPEPATLALLGLGLAGLGFSRRKQ